MVVNDADNGQANVDPGAGDRPPPLERNPKEDDWKAFQKVQPKFYLDKDWDVFYGDWELATVFLGLRKFEHILRAMLFVLRTDSKSVENLQTMKEVWGIYARW